MALQHPPALVSQPPGHDLLPAVVHLLAALDSSGRSLDINATDG